MIRVDRGQQPTGFETRSANWQRRFAEAQEQNSKLTPSRFWTQVRPEMQTDVQTLFDAFHGKCAFCESCPSHVSSPHIEHYRPKSQFPDQMFVWRNWLLSCGRCNEKKWAHFPDCTDQPCLLDPTSEDPADHLDFFEAQILDKTLRGAKTIQIIGLDRAPLVEERARWLMTINLLLLLVCCVRPAYTEARQLLIWAMQSDAPYAAMTRAYLRRKVPRLANPDTPHPLIEPHNQREHIINLLERYRDQLQELE
jgi:uncharacterized protein (TIGR02646 family)